VSYHLPIHHLPPRTIDQFLALKRIWSARGVLAYMPKMQVGDMFRSEIPLRDGDWVLSSKLTITIKHEPMYGAFLVTRIK